MCSNGKAFRCCCCFSFVLFLLLLLLYFVLALAFVFVFVVAPAAADAAASQGQPGLEEIAPGSIWIKQQNILLFLIFGNIKIFSNCFPYSIPRSA